MTATLALVLRRFADEVWRDGGQRGAKRNAWQAMAADNVRARDRAEAVALLDSLHGPRPESTDREESRPA
jgi:hypothetical protein